MTTGYTAFKDLKKTAFVLAALPRHVQPAVLEVGCGSGNLTAALAGAGARVAALDVDERSLASARQHVAGADVAFIAGDAAALPLRGPFDAVVCSEVLEHLPAPAVALARMRAVLRPGGALVVTVPNGHGPYEVTNRVLERLEIRDAVKRLVISPRERARRLRESTFNDHTPHVQHFSLAALRTLLADAGFAIVRVAHSDFLSWVPYVRHVQPVARLDCALADRLPARFVSGWYVHAVAPERRA